MDVLDGWRGNPRKCRRFRTGRRSSGVAPGVRNNDDLAHDAVVGKASIENQRNIQNLLVAQTPIAP
jgi:hypothetical protein